MQQVRRSERPDGYNNKPWIVSICVFPTVDPGSRNDMIGILIVVLAYSGLFGTEPRRHGDAYPGLIPRTMTRMVGSPYTILQL